MNALGINNSLAESYITTAENLNPEVNNNIIDDNLELNALNSLLAYYDKPICT